MLNPLPLTVPAETVVLAVPGFDIVTVAVTDFPISTRPKYKAEGERFSAPDPVVVEPLARTCRVVLGFPAFDVNESVPVLFPLAVGVNEISRLLLLPTGIVMGN